MPGIRQRVLHHGSAIREGRPAGCIEVIRHPDRYLAVGSEVPEVDFIENGYLFLATEAGMGTLEHHHAVQRSLDVPVALLTPAELRRRFDWIHADDLAGASLGLADEGWFDAYARWLGMHGMLKRKP